MFGFYGISTFVGYLNQNLLYGYTISLRFVNEYLVGKIFDQQDFICLHMVNRFPSVIFLVQPCLSQEGQNVIYFDVLEQIDLVAEGLSRYIQCRLSQDIHEEGR